MNSPNIKDSFNRPLHDLRISVIDRCNFRCPYCMPESEINDSYKFLKKEEWLTFDEIFRLTKIFVGFGVAKVRLTGGEPLLRPNLIDLIKHLSEVEEIDDLTLTTNGALLAQNADRLKHAGLKRITVSLDTMDSKIFRHMSGQKGSINQVLEGIKAAEEIGFDSLKINVVVQKGVNDHTILDLVNYFKNSNHILRFIEYMDVGNCNHWQSEYVVPSAEIVKIINKYHPIKPVESNYYGEVAQRYQFEDGSGEIGFVSSVTQPFCRTCTRVRLSTDGKMITCLFASDGFDLKTPLRSGASDEELCDLIKSVWQKREDRYSELRSQILSSNQHPKRLEMFQIGG